jgi:hypothetical protein
MVLIKHQYKKYIDVSSNAGYSQSDLHATRFTSIFKAMKFLADQGQEDIAEYEFIQYSQNVLRAGR